MKELEYNICETVENWFAERGLEALNVCAFKTEEGDIDYIIGDLKPSLLDSTSDKDGLDLAMAFWQEVSAKDKRFEGRQLRFHGDTKFTIEI